MPSFKYKYNKYLSKINGGYDINIICSNLIINTIDINDIACVVVGQLNPKKEYETIEIIFNNGESKIFKYEKRLGRGSYGFVLSYTSDNETKIVVKYGFEPANLDFDISIMEELKNDIDCKETYIGAYLHEMKNDKIIIMPFMDNDLSNLLKLKTLKSYSIFQIMIGLFEMVLCLYKKNLYYTDLKPPNILCKCISNSKMKILLGDLGGIYKKSHLSNDLNRIPQSIDFAVATFPWLVRSLKYEKDFGFILKKDLSLGDILYPLAVTYLMLGGINVKEFQFDEISKKYMNGKFYYENIIDLKIHDFIQKLDTDDVKKNIVKDILNQMLQLNDIENEQEKIQILTELFDMLKFECEKIVPIAPEPL